MLLCKFLLLQMEIPAETLDIMYTVVTTYHLIYLTVRASHFAFSAPLSRVILEFVCEQQPTNFLPFHSPYPVSVFRQWYHSGVKGWEKSWSKDKNGFHFQTSVRDQLFSCQEQFYHKKGVEKCRVSFMWTFFCGFAHIIPIYVIITPRKVPSSILI